MIVNNIQDWADAWETTVDRLKRDTYKYTPCGAWIDFDDEKMTIGSIVEGSDAEFSKTFVFPVDTDAVNAWFEELEELTDEAWHEANGWEDEEDA